MPTRPKVTVGICTYHRNDELERLLNALDALARDANGQIDVRAVVVDDSADARARAIVEHLATTMTYPLEYAHAGASNISVARNLVLERGSIGADFLVLIDDDCLPDPGWLRELLRIQSLTGADIVTGHRQFFVAESAPAWLSNEPFCDENSIYDDASEPPVGLTANVLIAVPWLVRSATTFRVSLGRTGGEDMAFFADAKRAGAAVRHAAQSVVREEFASQRATLKYQMYRQFWLGNNSAVHSLSTHQFTRVRLVVRGAHHLVEAQRALAVRAIKRRPVQWRWYIASMVRAIGLVVGALGVKIRHRS